MDINAGESEVPKYLEKTTYWHLTFKILFSQHRIVRNDEILKSTPKIMIGDPLNVEWAIEHVL